MALLTFSGVKGTVSIATILLIPTALEKKYPLLLFLVAGVTLLSFLTGLVVLPRLSENKEEYVKEFFSLKPCIHGSDAHCYEKLFRPDKNRYCWVKSIPTFEGIRQMLFEPKERVYIGETFPNKKQPYNC